MGSVCPLIIAMRESSIADSLHECHLLDVAAIDLAWLTFQMPGWVL